MIQYVCSDQSSSYASTQYMVLFKILLECFPHAMSCEWSGNVLMKLLYLARFNMHVTPARFFPVTSPAGAGEENPFPIGFILSAQRFRRISIVRLYQRLMNPSLATRI